MPPQAKAECYKTLERLGIDCLDLYYLHRQDGVTPVEDTVKAFKELIAEGKIKYVLCKRLCRALGCLGARAHLGAFCIGVASFSRLQQRHVFAIWFFTWFAAAG